MEYGKKKKMMYGGMAKKKMYGGGMTKKKKMKDGGMARKKMMKPAKPAKPAGRPKMEGPPIDPNTGKPMRMAKKGGMMKPVDKEKNPGLAKLPTEVRNKMGFMKKGGLTDAIKKVKKKQAMKMMGGGMTIKKMKHGGKAGKCPRDGIAMKGKTRAGR